MKSEHRPRNSRIQIKRVSCKGKYGTDNGSLELLFYSHELIELDWLDRMSESFKTPVDPNAR